MQVTGRIKLIGKTQTFGTNGFRKRDLIITTEEQYPQHILVELVQDKCDLVNNMKVAQLVEVNINLRGREWVNPQGETKYFNSIQGWRVTAMEQQPQQAAQAQSSNNTPKEEAHDDLPF